MKKLITVCLVVVSALAWGTPFVTPPETNPNITWDTLPYQRDIMMDFSTNPVGPTGPIPGAVYDGADDLVLWDSDFVTIDGNIEWNETKGGIGIFGGGSGTITFHFDNWERDWPIKHFYEELIFNVEIDTGSIYQNFVTPSGTNQYTDSWDKVDNLGGGSYRLSLWVEFEPNPPWEEKVITLSSTIGNIYIDSLHVATECVPEPATMLMLGLGGLLIRKRSR
jgi:hypothetical protein